MTQEKNYNNEYVSPLETYFKDEWGQLDSKEKAILVNYKRHLNMGIVPTRLMVKVVNDIHDKYPDFHVGCIP